MNALSQAVGTLVLGEREWEQKAGAQIGDSRQSLQKALMRMQEEHSGAFSLYESCTNFVFLKTDRAESLFQGLLQHGIAIRHMGGYLRVTAGNEEENAAFLRAFGELIAEEETK